MTKQYGRALAAAAALALALAACGGGGGGGSEAQVSAAEAVAAKADLATFKGNGIWWNPAEPGSGLFFESQGNTAVASFYVYETNGRPVWYTALGSFAAGTGEKYEFSGVLQRFSGGQSDKAATPRTPSGTVAGTVAIAFDGFKAQVQLPGRSYQVQKFYQSGASGTAGQPETGIYWNPAESGRGYTVEVNNNVATVGVFHYADDGQPTWHLSVMQLPGGSAVSASGDFMGYAGGQTLSGAYKAPTSSAAEGKFGVSFGEACKGRLSFPSMASIPVQRLPMGSLAPGKECRTPAAPPPVVTYFNDVTLTLVSPVQLESDASLGSTMPPAYRFSAAGNIASLNGKTVYVIVEDPDGFFTATTPRVEFDPSPGATVFLTPAPLARAGRYQSQLKFYACLNATCTTQFKGSPFLLPYNFTVR